MMDKVIGWVLVGISLFVMSYVGAFVMAMGGEAAAMNVVKVFVVVGFMMACTSQEGDSWMDRIMGGVTGFVMSALWFALAVTIYLLISMLVAGALNPIGLLHAFVFVAVNAMLSALVFSCIKNAQNS